ncbi:hypothetical protein G3480_21975 [Thiorhodococcus mannitoliphagus]|uniref:HdeD family acid-resistance protein n=1 Tax=Thiorhodococcus mannitoliphagus TaxID=329406 RepID=A0A6P1E5T1_9GAMM|nr:DUF308 domain-containing protein [Thiorhodococcus mannitoliphagus]NEX22935.1 hypothetical protein [Thiorhodococcus mannitoliphagus]
MQVPDNKITLDPAALIEQEVNGFGSHSFWIGLLLMMLGAVGIALPPAMAITTVDVISLMLFIGGGFWLWHTAKHGGGLLRWLKPLALIAAGVLMISRPVAGAEALALLLSFYLLLDAFGSFALAYELRPARGWGWMIASGVVDLLLVVFFTFSWPASSLVVLGIFVGTSLLFDGAALTAIGWSLRRH